MKTNMFNVLQIGIALQRQQRGDNFLQGRQLPFSVNSAHILVLLDVSSKRSPRLAEEILGLFDCFKIEISKRRPFDDSLFQILVLWSALYHVRLQEVILQQVQDWLIIHVDKSLPANLQNTSILIIITRQYAKDFPARSADLQHGSRSCTSVRLVSVNWFKSRFLSHDSH